GAPAFSMVARARLRRGDVADRHARNLADDAGLRRPGRGQPAGAGGGTSVECGRDADLVSGRQYKVVSVVVPHTLKTRQLKTTETTRDERDDWIGLSSNQPMMVTFDLQQRKLSTENSTENNAHPRAGTPSRPH